MSDFNIGLVFLVFFVLVVYLWRCNRRHCNYLHDSIIDLTEAIVQLEGELNKSKKLLADLNRKNVREPS